MQSSHELCPQPLGNLRQIKRKRQCKITYKQFQIVLEYAKLTDHFPTRHMHPTPTRLRAHLNLVLQKQMEIALVISTYDLLDMD
jgi:hypothetical protein